MSKFPGVIFTALLLFSAALLPYGVSAEVTQYRVKVLRSYPHDSKAYTQGLFFKDGVLYESTGQYGGSSIRKVDLKTGKVLEQVLFSRRYFGEGSCIVDGKMYVLTWRNKVAFVYDPGTLKYEKTLSWPREGWGLAEIPQESRSGGEVMVCSDGTSTLYFLDSSMQVKRKVSVALSGRELSYLNELEWIDGRIWANVYTTDWIVIINPRSGVVEGKIDCGSLCPAEKRTPEMDVLNGIALAPDGGIWLTGKNWPKMYEVKLIAK